MNTMKKIFIVILLSLFFGTNAVFAAELIGGHEKEAVTISGNESHNNIYTAGNVVQVKDGTISGDAYVAGGTVTIDSAIEKDLVVAGGVVTINGRIGDDVRVAGGTIIINGPIGGDLLVAGGEVVINREASVARDLLVAGGTVKIHGNVQGSLKAAGGSIFINSFIGGPVVIKAEKEVVFQESARISQNVTYKGKKEAVVENGAVVSNIAFTKIEDQGIKHLFGSGLVIKILALIMASLLLLRFLPKQVNTVVHAMHGNPLKYIGFGILWIVLLPVVVGLLFLTLIGYYTALVVLTSYFLLLLVACIFSSIFIGSWIEKVLMKRETMVLDWQAVVIGVAVTTVLMGVPVVGWILVLILMSMAFGAVMSTIKQKLTANSQ